MGEILGLGLTHYPPLIGLDENMADILRAIMQDPGLPGALPRSRQLARAAMRREYGDDGGTASAAGHRGALVAHFRHARKHPRRVPPGRGGDLGRRPARELHRGHDPALLRARLRPDGGAHLAARRHRAQRLGRARRDDVPHRGAPRGRQVPRAAAPRAGRRHGLRLQAPALPGPRPRVPEHDHVPRLRPRRLPVPGHRVPGELLRAPGDRPAGRARQPRQPARRGGPRSAVAVAEALHGGGRRDRAGHAREPVADRAHRLVELVARLPHRQAPPALPRHRGGPAALRGAPRSATTTRGARPRSTAIETSGQQEMLNWYMLVGAMEALGRKPDECDFIETWSSTRTSASPRSCPDDKEVGVPTPTSHSTSHLHVAERAPDQRRPPAQRRHPPPDPEARAAQLLVPGHRGPRRSGTASR